VGGARDRNRNEGDPMNPLPTRRLTLPSGMPAWRSRNG
jgi:hypothetical protein